MCIYECVVYTHCVQMHVFGVCVCRPAEDILCSVTIRQPFSLFVQAAGLVTMASSSPPPVLVPNTAGLTGTCVTLPIFLCGCLD